MNENIDLTKILDGCPQKTKFFSSVYGDVLFQRKTEFKQIIMRKADGVAVYFMKDGKVYDYEGAECTIFPSKDQRDWSKFERFWDKPKVERFDPKLFQPFDKVLFRIEPTRTWVCSFFSHIIEDDFGKKSVWSTVGMRVQCIPYNDETKHLVGTTDDCPEYYKWWEE